MDTASVPASWIFREPRDLGGYVPVKYRLRMEGAEDGYHSRPAPHDADEHYLLGHAWGRAMAARKIRVVADRPRIAAELRQKARAAGFLSGIARRMA